jgi:uncharacterized repeat protein (TIGR03803 family)
MNIKAEFKSRMWLQLKNLLAIQAGALLLCLSAASGKAQTYSILYNFTGGNDGFQPGGCLVLSGATLYGTAGNDGAYGYGTLFKINTNGSGFTVLKSFDYYDGTGPDGLVLSGTTLYGTAGGGNGDGELFKINTNGSGFTVLEGFPGMTNGYDPNAPLLLSGMTLYGTTAAYISGGSYGYGTVFQINADGSGYKVLKYFSGGDDGKWPYTGLVLSGTTLYGTTSSGGAYGNGTVFAINTDGSGFTVLKAFAGGSDGAYPNAPLLLSGPTLYGTTYLGGDFGCGTMFSVNTNGSGYTVLKHFAGYSANDGANPAAALVLFGATLYGTTDQGGSTNSNYGTVFKINTDGSGYKILKVFTGADGRLPGGLLLSGAVLYGVTAWGGGGYGDIFSLSLPAPTIISLPQSQTAEVGSTANFTPDVAGDPVMTYEWFFNGTNLISCSTNCALQLTNIQFSQSGSYTVIITNAFGAVTSAPVLLNVIAPVARRPVPGVQVMGKAGSLLNVDYANSLSPSPNWTAVGPVSLTSTSQYCFDVTVPVPLPSQRFYRAWQTGTPSVVPSLNLSGMVTAITLTGNVGDSLQVDYINQFGPTNAWVTLGTVTLTNTSQLYFDVSAIGQPPRLYQIVPVP